MLQRPYRLVAFVLLALFPFAVAQEPKETPKPAAAAAPEPGALFLKKFDLNKDGKVDWDEYQKVRSGFTGLDANGDGVIASADFKLIMERNQARMQQEMQRRMMQGMREGWGRRMREAMGRRMRAWGHEGRRNDGARQQGFGPGMGPRWMQPPRRGQGGPGPGATGQRGPRGPMAKGDVCPWCHQPFGRGGARGMGPGRGMGWGPGAPGADDDDDDVGSPPPPAPPGR
ncbi:MAG TPA: hypothetical protein VFY93_19095 [Planctomycetota bacterium]|nr:hypothetical protein [Planctomycetota bacterium]